MSTALEFWIKTGGRFLVIVGALTQQPFNKETSHEEDGQDMSSFFQFCTAVAATIGVLLLIKKRLEETMLPMKATQINDELTDGFMHVSINVPPRSIPATITEASTPDGILAYSNWESVDAWGQAIIKPVTHSASPALSLNESILPLSVNSEGDKLFFFFKPFDVNASVARITLKTSETWASKRHTIHIKYTIKNE